MTRKFSISDRARIAPAPRPRWWPNSIHPGHIVTIKEIITRGPHCFYRTGDNGKDSGRIFRSDELRRLSEGSLRGGKRKGAGRKNRATQNL